MNIVNDKGVIPVMLSPTKANEKYVLASELEDGNLAILCRSHGSDIGPAIATSKKDAIKLKTNLASDPRAHSNPNALKIIHRLLIYKLDPKIRPIWEEGSLWAYIPANFAQCVESQFGMF